MSLERGVRTGVLWRSVVVVAVVRSRAHHLMVTWEPQVVHVCRGKSTFAGILAQVVGFSHETEEMKNYKFTGKLTND